MSTYDYEVFLSFRGPDTRSGFTDFLYTSLIEAGIRAYKDDEDLRVGEEIGPELLRAIKQSKISIPIFSKGYASSKWCLMELVQMVKCKKETGQKILPIFYDVTPAEVRHQTGDYDQAFYMHAQEKRYDDGTINEWKATLEQVGALKGWDLASEKIRREGELAKAIVKNVLIRLKKAYLLIPDYLVEVDSKVDEIMRMIGAHSDETKIVGIHGMGGIGKTTLAKIMYNKLSEHFQQCCFLSNVRETSNQKGIEHMQNQLVSNVLGTEWANVNNVDEGIKMIEERLCTKKLLFLLDDVDEKIQLNALMGKRDWFGQGSKIIITTRNREILNVPEVDSTYEVMSMDFDHSLQLFSRHAFRSDQPLKDYVEESKRAVKISGHLPLTLEVIGSYLCGKEKELWGGILGKLENIPREDVIKKLIISFEALDRPQKNIFLDIACFFIGFDRRIVSHMWESCGFYPDEAMEVLQLRSLIKIEDDNQLWMHDQLRDLGREIVRQQSQHKLEEQSRVWDHAEGLDVLTRIKGRRNTEAICLKLDHQSQFYFTIEEFVSLPNLKFLQVESINATQHPLARTRFLWRNWRSNVPKEPFTLPKLRWLSWHNYPQFFKLTSFSLTNLVILDLSESKITENWDGWKHIKMAKNLKILNLTRCTKLKRTPIFSSHVKLEQLILEYCDRLAQIDKSIGQLTHLVFLNLSYCRKLRELPDEVGKLEALTMLLMVGTRVIQLPNSIGQLLSLTKLDLSRTRMMELPQSLGKMKNLKVLRFSYSSFNRLPSSIGMLEKLEEIDCELCLLLGGAIPSNIVELPNLRILKLTWTNIESLPKLPDSLNKLWFGTESLVALEDCSNLTNLTYLMLELGFKATVKPLEDLNLWWIGRLCKLESLYIRCGRCITIPTDITLLSQLKKLTLSSISLRCLPQLPRSLSCLVLRNCDELSASIDLSNLFALEELVVSKCKKIKEFQGLECLENLRKIRLLEALGLETLPDLTSLTRLTDLILSKCWNVTRLRGLNPSLSTLCIRYCGDLFASVNLSNLIALETLYIYDFKDTKEIQGLDCLENLRSLCIVEAKSLEKLPDLTNFKQLSDLVLRDCPSVIELEGTSESLMRITLESCLSVEKLPHPSKLKKLQSLHTDGSRRLNDYLKSSNDWRDWKCYHGGYWGKKESSTGEHVRQQESEFEIL